MISVRRELIRKSGKMYAQYFAHKFIFSSFSLSSFLLRLPLVHSVELNSKFLPLIMPSFIKYFKKTAF